MKIKKNFGFTLIELLVTISIIGLLTSIILASITTARKNAQDAKIKDQMVQIRTAAALYYDNQSPNTYGVINPIASCLLEDPGYCACTGSTVSGTVFADSKVVPLVTPTNFPAGVTLNCIAGDSFYVVTASLVNPQGGNTHWCVDSLGNSKARAGAADIQADVSC